MEGPLRKPGNLIQITGATAAALGANQGLDLSCKLPVRVLCVRGAAVPGMWHLAGAALQQLKHVLELTAAVPLCSFWANIC